MIYYLESNKTCVENCYSQVYEKFLINTSSYECIEECSDSYYRRDNSDSKLYCVSCSSSDFYAMQPYHDVYNRCEDSCNKF